MRSLHTIRKSSFYLEVLYAEFAAGAFQRVCWIEIEYVKLDLVLSLQNELVFVLALFYNFGFKELYCLGLYMIFV
jgi:hypothetical protein